MIQFNCEWYCFSHTQTVIYDIKLVFFINYYTLNISEIKEKLILDY